MARHIAKKSLTPEAKLVLDEGRKFWKRYHSLQFGRTIRDEFNSTDQMLAGIKSADRLNSTSGMT
jgi:hypothetical protein